MIVVVDHYDSFVYNLVQLVQASGRETLVIRSDELSATGAAALAADGVILSPGPGRPESAGCMVELVRALPTATPVLGVCLGCQAVAVAFGATVERAPEPVHGKASRIGHTGSPLFAGVPTPFVAGRYHSLMVRREGLPAELSVTAESEDGLVMALEHRELPRFGVQFHPESILTPDGPRIIENFLALAQLSVGKESHVAISVTDNAERDRYEASVGGAAAGFAAYRRHDSSIEFTHTEVDSAHEGRGVGSELVGRALDDARERGLRVRPLCPFVRSYIERHPAYRDLVVDS